MNCVKESMRKAPIYATVYASFFDTHAQLPILALFAGSVGADSFGIGVVVGIYSVLNIVGNGLGGTGIDRWGWRKPLLLGLIFVTLALYGYQFVESTRGLIFVRGLHGLAGGILVPASLASLSPRSGSEFKMEHSRNVAYYGTFIGFAALTGPPFAGIVSGSYGFKGAYLGIAIILTIATLLAFFATKEARGDEIPKTVRFHNLFRVKIPPISFFACLFAFCPHGRNGDDGRIYAHCGKGYGL
jgi:MFS transporter, DHA1 family, multidrug resistance protein